MDNFSTVCRLCFNSALSDVADDKIYQKISVCLGLIINPTNKSWPYRVCSECVAKVEEFHAYRESCWDVHFMLLNMLGATKSDGDAVPALDADGSTRANTNEDFTFHETKHENETASNGNSTDEHCGNSSTASEQRKKRSKGQSSVVVCEMCGKALLPTFYQGHLNEHNGVKPFVCETPACGQKFSCRHALRRHSYYRHSGQTFYCQECGKEYKSKMELSAHRLHVHTRGKAFACEKCGKSFVTRSYLKVHLKTHADGPREQCSYCPKMLYSKKGLKYHELLHTHELPFRCPECSSKFRSRRQLNIHMQGACSNGTE